jgi:hypothetical protein
MCSIVFSCAERKDVFLDEVLFGNNDERLINYDAVSDSEKQLFWSEEFDNNDSGWPIDVGEYSDANIKIENGNFVADFFLNDTIRYWYYNMPIKIPDEHINFEVEIRLVLNDEDDTRKFAPYMAAFHDATSRIAYVLIYRGDWGIRLFKQTYSNDTVIFDCKEIENLQLNQFNIVTIRKIANKYAIFINHKFFYLFEDTHFNYNPSILFETGRVSVYDYFRVYYLSPQSLHITLKNNGALPKVGYVLKNKIP